MTAAPTPKTRLTMAGCCCEWWVGEGAMGVSNPTRWVPMAAERTGLLDDLEHCAGELDEGVAQRIGAIQRSLVHLDKSRKGDSTQVDLC